MREELFETHFQVNQFPFYDLICASINITVFLNQNKQTRNNEKTNKAAYYSMIETLNNIQRRTITKTKYC